jgi:hypothetical protein
VWGEAGRAREAERELQGDGTLPPGRRVARRQVHGCAGNGGCRVGRCRWRRARRRPARARAVCSMLPASRIAPAATWTPAAPRGAGPAGVQMGTGSVAVARGTGGALAWLRDRGGHGLPAGRDSAPLSPRCRAAPACQPCPRCPPERRAASRRRWRARWRRSRCPGRSRCSRAWVASGRQVQGRGPWGAGRWVREKAEVSARPRLGLRGPGPRGGPRGSWRGRRGPRAAAGRALNCQVLAAGAGRAACASCGRDRRRRALRAPVASGS